MTYRQADNGIQWYVEQEAQGRDKTNSKEIVIAKVFYSEQDCKDYIDANK